MNRIKRLTAWLAAVSLTALCAGCVSRDGWQKPDQVIEALAISPGERIGDIGSGEGYFTWYLAEATGPGGKVYAIDVSEAANARVEEDAQERRLTNVETVLCEVDDPAIPEAVDLVFTCNAYHHLDDRVEYFSGLKRYLRPGARVAIVELDGEGFFRRTAGHYTLLETIQREMEAAGYTLRESFDFLPRQSFVVFVAASPSSDPESDGE